MASREVELTLVPRVDLSDLDPEVAAVSVVVAALVPLDEHARRRVMRYLAARFADGVPEPAPRPAPAVCVACGHARLMHTAGGACAGCTSGAPCAN